MKQHVSPTHRKLNLTRPGSSQHLSLPAHDVLQAMSKTWSWNCPHGNTENKHARVPSVKMVFIILLFLPYFDVSSHALTSCQQQGALASLAQPRSCILFLKHRPLEFEGCLHMVQSEFGVFFFTPTAQVAASGRQRRLSSKGDQSHRPFSPRGDPAEPRT